MTTNRRMIRRERRLKLKQMSSQNASVLKRKITYRKGTNVFLILLGIVLFILLLSLALLSSMNTATGHHH